MGSIDVHTHFIPQVYLDALTRIGMSAEQFGFPVIPWDMNKRLQVMNDNDIDVEMLSISSEPGLHYWPQHEAIDLVKKLNDELAEIIRANPKRFGGYTTLPLPYIDAALAELARGYDELGIDGVVLITNYEGTYLGDPKLTPVMEELNRRKAVVFVHPTESPCSDQLTQGYVAPAFEYPADTTRMVASLIDNDITTRFPDIRFILSHGGGTIPMMQDRMALVMPWKRHEDQEAGTKRINDAIGSLYYDLAMVQYPAPLAAIAKSHDISKVLTGYDLPFFPSKGMPAIRENVLHSDAFSDADRDLIARGNALTLFPRLAAAASNKG